MRIRQGLFAVAWILLLASLYIVVPDVVDLVFLGEYVVIYRPTPTSTNGKVQRVCFGFLNVSFRPSITSAPSATLTFSLRSRV